ncbi:TPA: ParB-like nuclease domain-containing protein [Pseudomonas aeruginosa]|nr:ParB-like nuclease domain-containing protein [Pseudomonas aeruginosa]HCH7803200.1 ParB-like nuclease domain-containing protein [Pseudomonas aeruginosa]HCI4168599.1 ParB-like nuclease domain-containing protein [Pseudomonas aeruginosa]HCI7165004.1 ParB-like nuclease domain-containing protein [Pseudomonas aeruginosa]HCJ0752200.1 ParB-like nuclease domain-containing protein [Pseudomonas aeruginosa]
MASPTAIQTSKLRRNRRRLGPPSQAQVDAMVESIRALGMIVKPLDVRRVGDSYEIVDGEVRWLAAQQLNIDIVPIQVIPLDDHANSAAALILNMDRESIAPDEVITSLERLVSEFGEDAAEIVLERLPELREAAASNPEFQQRVSVLMASCKIDTQS